MKKAALFLGLLSNACYAMEKNKELSIWLPDNYVVSQGEQQMRDELRQKTKDVGKDFGLHLPSHVKKNLEASDQIKYHAAFLTAVGGNYLMVLKDLMESGISPNFVMPQVSDWATPLSLAASVGHEDVMRVLLSGGAEPNSIIKTGKDSYTILEVLVSANNLKLSNCSKMVISDEIIKLFCEHGAIVSSNALEWAKEGALREYLNEVYQKQTPLRAEIAKKLVQQGHEKTASINA